MEASTSIRAVGLISALGTDWATCCAAARAGLRRAHGLENFELQSPINDEPEAVVVHSAALVTRGFEGAARLLRLLAAGLRNLREAASGFDWADTRLGFYMALPDERRTSTALGLIDDASLRASFEREAGARSPHGAALDGESLLDRALPLAGLPAPPSPHVIVHRGSAAAVLSVQSACADLQSGTVAAAVVVAADSMLDESVLDWLNATARLKTSGMPAGLEPGEACAAMLLAPGAGSLGAISVIGSGSEPSALAAGATSTGAGTAGALMDVGARTGWGGQGRAWIVSDCNGEVYRANDLAMALVRLRARLPAFSSPLIDYPAARFGDTGAAAPLVGVCTALAAWNRGYAPADQAVILSVAESQERGALMVTREPSRQAS